MSSWTSNIYLEILYHSLLSSIALAVAALCPHFFDAPPPLLRFVSVVALTHDSVAVMAPVELSLDHGAGFPLQFNEDFEERALFSLRLSEILCSTATSVHFTLMCLLLFKASGIPSWHQRSTGNLDRLLRRLDLSWKVALGNNSLYQQVAVLCNPCSKRKAEEDLFTHHRPFPATCNRGYGL